MVSAHKSYGSSDFLKWKAKMTDRSWQPIKEERAKDGESVKKWENERAWYHAKGDSKGDLGLITVTFFKTSLYSCISNLVTVFRNRVNHPGCVWSFCSTCFSRRCSASSCETTPGQMSWFYFIQCVKCTVTMFFFFSYRSHDDFFLLWIE